MRIETFKGNNEKVLWKGKPNKSVFIKEKVFSPFLILSFIWGLLLAGGITGIKISTKDVDGGIASTLVTIFFIILALLPILLYLGTVVFSFTVWNNIEYMITDKAIYELSGIFTTRCKRKTFQEVTNISIHQGIIDKKYDVGDIYIIAHRSIDKDGFETRHGIDLVDLDDYLKVYKLISQTGSDVFSDTMYPNDLRPKENHGYKTNLNYDDFYDEEREED